MDRPVAPRRALFLVIIAGLAWGTGGAAAALLFTTGLGSIAVSFWRLAGGAFWLAIAWPVLGRLPLVQQLRAAPLRLIVTGLSLAIYQLAYFAAVDLVGVAISTVIALGAAPLITAAVTRERVTLTLVAALLGLTLLAFGNDHATTTASLAGIALSVLSAAGYALTTLINKNTPDPTGTALITFAIGATTLLPAALVEGAVPTPESLPAIAYLGLVPTALAYALFYTALKTLRPTTATLLALTEPLVATVLGLTVFHESLTPTGTAGAALLLGALTARTLRE